MRTLKLLHQSITDGLSEQLRPGVIKSLSKSLSTMKIMNSNSENH